MADIEKITQIGLVPAELINDLRQINAPYSALQRRCRKSERRSTRRDT